MTFSAGLTLIGDDQTLQQALQRADTALYVAKNQGRDCAVVADEARGVRANRDAATTPARRFLDTLSNIS